ncbi:MAG: allantoinase PuuE [Aestuariivita sp.]|nr:allantoinase PuuE [Aestuariivita sp.]
MIRYPRDMIGYGSQPPVANWPNSAKIAVQFVLNFEEGGENNILHSDHASEAFLSEIVGAQPWVNQRHWNMESIYEYGARAGFWRLHRLFVKENIPVTIYGVATALARCPEQVEAMKEAGWEIASHGLKWIEHKDMSEQEERDAILEAIRLHTEVVGEPPLGWYTGRCSMQTVGLIAETGQFAYVSDAYDDDLPYWRLFSENVQLVIPYALDTNDMRFATPQGFNSGDQFFTYLKDSFDALYEEGQAGQAKMMSIGLHCRLIGRPGRVQSLQRFMNYIKEFDDVWCARRIDIANHWKTQYPYQPKRRPHAMNQHEFMACFGDVFEHSPWIAERAFKRELGPAHDTASGLYNALARVFRSASKAERLAVLKAHPDLAGKLSRAKRLTKNSKSEQASAGLDALTDLEYEQFSRLNEAYTSKNGFPFIIAVRDYNKLGILAAFQRRLNNDMESEFLEACRQVERIARLRLDSLL